jgi:hypothetical protein
MSTVVPARGSTQPPKRLSLADSIRGGRKLPSRVIFHGQGGIGKTSWAAQAPSPFFLLSPGETGLHTLIDSGLVGEVPNLEVFDWDNAIAIIEELTSTNHAYKTLVIDTLDGMEKLANAHVCELDFKGDWGEKGFMSFQRGYKVTASGPWRGFLAALDKLREVKRMGIILLAHTGVGNFQNPSGPDFNRYTPDIYKDAWALAFGWADIVLFGQREVAVSKDDKTDRKAKGHGGDARVIYTEWSAFADAKNRHNLPPEIEMGTSGKEAWQNFIKAIAAGKNGNGKDGE